MPEQTEAPKPALEPVAPDEPGTDDALPDWVKDPEKAYREIKKVRAEAKETREALAKREKAEAEAAKAARAAEIQKLADESEFKKLAERLKAENDALNERIAKAERDSLLQRIAKDAGLPDGAWLRLQGTNEAELKADAESLKALLAPAQAMLAQGTQRAGTTPAPGGRPQGETDDQRRARLKGQTGASIFDKRG